MPINILTPSYTEIHAYILKVVEMEWVKREMGTLKRSSVLRSNVLLKEFQISYDSITAWMRNTDLKFRPSISNKWCLVKTCLKCHLTVCYHNLFPESHRAETGRYSDTQCLKKGDHLEEIRINKKYVEQVLFIESMLIFTGLMLPSSIWAPQGLVKLTHKINHDVQFWRSLQVI